MVIVSACLGGLAGAVAQGRAKLNLSWITNDGENQVCTFRITGTESKDIQSDANGFAVVDLPMGSYTVHVDHAGDYIGDDDKSITLGSRQVSTLTWLTGARQAQTVIFTAPGALSSSSVSYSIKMSGTEVMSGTSLWDAMMTFELYPGSYTLTLNAYGDSFEYSFDVPKTSGFSADLSDHFCALTVSSSYNVRNVTFRGYTALDTGNYASSHKIYVIRSSVAGNVGGTVNTPTPPSFSGLLTGSIYTWNVSGVSITPSTASATATLSCSRTGRVNIITSAGSLKVPSAKYRLWVIGGGGGGASGGGGSGFYAGGESESLGGTYAITIGAGGSAGDYNRAPTNGGASSFGTAYSASGGGKGGYSSAVDGGNGGAGGGGAGSYHPYDDDYYGGRGGTGYTCGGGGSGGNRDDESSCGPYGGKGGKGGTGSSNATSGSNGVKFPGYSGGYSGGYVYGGKHYGGGGGGGYGAEGGNGGSGYIDSSGDRDESGGGGGGGGMYGGSGGRGGSGNGYMSVTNSYNNTPPNSGTGYGAGGAGMSSGSTLGGGGAGGLGSTKVVSDGGLYGNAGAPGAVLIQWVG